MIARIMMKSFQKLFKGIKLNANEIAVCVDTEKLKYKSLESYLTSFSNQIEKKLIGEVVFEGDESGKVTLTKSVSDCKKVKIICRIGGQGQTFLPAIEIEEPSEKKFVVQNMNASSGMSFFEKTYQISDKTISIVNRSCMYVNANKVIEYVRQNSSDDWNIYISKVIAYF